MFIRLRSIPLFAAFNLGALAALVVVSLLLLPVARDTHGEFIAFYGEALSTMAAKQAVDATFNHDLVRLQVILQDLVANPYTALATIHDVENNLLVQAGDARGAIRQSAVFASPIVLHDSVAGHVSVTVDASHWSLRAMSALVLAMAALCLALALWSGLRSGAIQWAQAADSLSRAGREAPSPSPTADEAGTVLAPQPQAHVFAVIHIKNLHVLKQQLNGQSFRDTITRFEKIMCDVMALYGGHRFQLVDNYYVLQFHTRQNRGEALFNASCSAFLVLELAGIIDNIPLDLAALVSANEDDIVPEKLPFAGLILEATAGAEELINRRIEFMELGTDDGRRVLAGFHQPFKSLLENQRRQLCQIL